MKSPTDRFEERLERLLGAARAEADPAVLARARARLAAEADVPRTLAWLGTPAALVTACALLVAVTSAGVWLARDDAPAARDTSLVSALVGDDGSYGLPAAGATRDAENADSGVVTR